MSLFMLVILECSIHSIGRAKVKRQSKLNICGIDYDIEYVHDRAKSHGIFAGGSEHSWRTKIWIDTDQSEERIGWTLMHEVMEAINSANELELSHPKLSAIASGMYGVFKQLLKGMESQEKMEAPKELKRP